MTALEALEKGDSNAMLDALAALPPQERRKLAPKILSFCREWHKFDYSSSTNSYFKHGTDEQREAAKVGAIAVATASEIVRSGWSLNFILQHADAALSIVSRLRPPWLDADGLEMLADNEKIGWHAVEALIGAGYCERPKSDKLIESLIQHPWTPDTRPDSKTDYGAHLRDHLRQYPGLFKDDVLYRLFEVEGGPQSSLANSDKFGFNQWATALLELSRTGELDRNRLLDGCLAALSRDFIAFRASWFSRFHDVLDPTDEEVAARKDAYLRLTGSMIPRTVGFAVTAIERLAKLGELRPDEVLTALPPVVQSRQKSIVKRAAKLIVTAARRTPAGAAQAIEAMCDALVHPEPDVQKSLLDAIDALWPLAKEQHTSLQDRLAEARRLVAPSLRARLPDDQDREETWTVAAPAVESDPFADQYALTFAGNLDEAIDMVSYALEHEDEPIAQELAFDAIARFCSPTDDWAVRTGPLRQRAETLYKRHAANSFREHCVQHLLAWSALAWTGREKPDLSGRYLNSTKDLEFYGNRTGCLVDRVIAGKGLPLLSTPTHRSGHTTYQRYTDVLEEWIEAKEPLDPYDVVLALMRLPRQDRAKARRAVTIKPARAFDQAARCERPGYTHEITSRRSRCGKFKFYLLHVEPDRKFPEPKSALNLRLALIQGDDNNVTSELARWCATLTPDDLQAHFATGLRCLLGEYNLDEIDNPLMTGLWLEPAREPWVDIGPEGHWLLTLMLASRGARAIEVALDVAIDGISQGRANAEQLGGVLATLMTSGMFKAKRMAAAFAQIAPVSPAHAQWVRQAIACGLRGDPAAAPRDVGTLLSLLHELLVEAREKLEDPEARYWLESARRGGQVAKLRKSILSL